MNSKPENEKTPLSARERWRNLCDAISAETDAEDTPSYWEAEEIKNLLLRKLNADPRAPITPSEDFASPEYFAALEQYPPPEEPPEGIFGTRGVGAHVEDYCPQCQRITTHRILSLKEDADPNVQCERYRHSHRYMKAVLPKPYQSEEPPEDQPRDETRRSPN